MTEALVYKKNMGLYIVSYDLVKDDQLLLKYTTIEFLPLLKASDYLMHP